MTTGHARSGAMDGAARRIAGIASALVMPWLASGAQAQDLSRFEACVGPELDARARLVAYDAPCMADDSCPWDPEEEPASWHSVVEPECFGRQVEDCIVSVDAGACFVQFASLPDAERREIVAELTEDRVLAAADAVGGFRARSLRRNFEVMLVAVEEAPCPDAETIERSEDGFSLPRGTYCDTYRSGSEWVRARTYRRMVQRAEREAGR